MATKRGQICESLSVRHCSVRSPGATHPSSGNVLANCFIHRSKYPPEHEWTRHWQGQASTDKRWKRQSLMNSHRQRRWINSDLMISWTNVPSGDSYPQASPYTDPLSILYTEWQSVTGKIATGDQSVPDVSRVDCARCVPVSSYGPSVSTRTRRHRLQQSATGISLPEGNHLEAVA